MSWQSCLQLYQRNTWKWLVGSKAEVQNCNTWSVLQVLRVRVFVSFYFALLLAKSPLRCNFVRKYVSDSAGQSIQPLTPCEISYHKSTIKSNSLQESWTNTVSWLVVNYGVSWTKENPVVTWSEYVCVSAFICTGI